MRCGVIFTDAFIDFLSGAVARDGPSRPGEILAIDYVRCKEGPRAGQAWLEWYWLRRESLPEQSLFSVRDFQVFLSPQTQHGLKWHYIDCVANVPVVG